MSKLEVKIEQPTVDDLAYLSENLRASDVEETESATGIKSMALALRLSVRVSEESLVGHINGTPVCIWGVQRGPIIGGYGIPWLVGTELVAKYQRTFLRRNKVWVEKTRRRYRYLMNFVDARNDKAIAWLRWLGFHLEPSAPYGPFNKPFHRFLMRGEV